MLWFTFSPDLFLHCNSYVEIVAHALTFVSVINYIFILVARHIAAHIVKVCYQFAVGTRYDYSWIH
jgi:hypothetical protein